MIPRRTDANQKEIVAGLRRLNGVSVFLTHSVGGGFPDICVGFRGVNYLFEIKDGNKTRSGRKLTERQIEFYGTWRGKVDVVLNVRDIVKIIGWNEPV